MTTLASANADNPYHISSGFGTIERLRRRHRGLDDFWIEEFRYGLECLTEGETGHLHTAPSSDTIRNRLAEARRDLYLDGDEGFDSEEEQSAASVNDKADGSPEGNGR